MDKFAIILPMILSLVATIYDVWIVAKKYREKKETKHIEMLIKSLNSVNSELNNVIMINHANKDIRLDAKQKESYKKLVEEIKVQLEQVETETHK